MYFVRICYCEVVVLNVEMGMGGKCKVKIENKGVEIEIDGMVYLLIVWDGMMIEGMKIVGNIYYYIQNYVCMGMILFFYLFFGFVVVFFII